MTFDRVTPAWRQSRPLVALALLVGACDGAAFSADVPSQQPSPRERSVDHPIPIQILVDRHIVTAELEPSAAAQDFASLLPLDVTLRDHNRTEKIADLQRRLAIDGAPDGIAPVIGDIAYYAPWGNLAIFYRDFAYLPGLVRLGRLKGDAAVLTKHDGPVRIERRPSGAKGESR